jgi:hypothetical protein
MRLISVLAAACALACAGRAPATAPAPAPAPTAPAAAPSAAQGQNPAGGQAAGGARQDSAGGGRQGGPRPYNQVITRQAVTDSGVFIVHRVNDQYYYEIPRTMLGREFTFIADRRGTQRGVGWAGEEVVDRVVRWERLGNKVFLRVVSYAMAADTTLPVSRAVRLSNQSPIIMSFDVATWSRDSNAVVDVTRLFTTDVPEVSMRRQLRARRLDPARSAIERVKSFPRNVEVSAYHTFEVDSVPGQGGGNQALGGLSTITLFMNWSMVLLPDRPMAARLCDNRVGFFSVQYEDYGRDEYRVPSRCFITRWRLEPKDPNAAVSDPIKPIVFYLDPATPERWAPWIIAGVKQWEPVFRAAGFSNAITARRAPTEAEDPEFDLDDARYSTIRWLPSLTENAYGPHTSDPRSGEILQSNIGWFQNITSLLQAWYFAQAGAVDQRVRNLPLPDSLMGEMVAYVAAHEVGHTLGLPHNQLSSGTYPIDSLRSPTYTRANGTSYSIMDYARNNYVAQPGDDVQLMPKIGPYDYYSIDWGYRRIPGATTADAERPVLDSLARLQDTRPWLRFGNPDGIDPRTQTEALGDDPVKASRYGLQNIKRLVPMLIPATTSDRLHDYDLLDDFYGRVIGQWGLEMNHVAVVVGGVWRHERYPSQDGPIHQPVPRARQVEAVRFLNENAFTTPTYFLDTAILRRIEPTGFVDRVRVRQSALLNTLFQDQRLSRLVEQEGTLGRGAAYTLSDLFDDVRGGVFSELRAAAPAIDAYRRNLQNSFLDQMDRLLNTPLAPPQQGGGFGGGFGGPPPPPRPADARAQARVALLEVQRGARAALPKTTDRATRAHLTDLVARAERMLNPR